MKLPVVAEKFIKYVKIDTQSREELSDKVPSTENREIWRWYYIRN